MYIVLFKDIKGAITSKIKRKKPQSSTSYFCWAQTKNAKSQF